MICEICEKRPAKKVTRDIHFCLECERELQAPPAQEETPKEAAPQ